MPREEVVSSASEQLILVDELDRVIGAKLKSECHEGDGTLHRAFSIFVFNDRDELLLQKRSSAKPLWPNYWSNTCCSHPRVGETMDEAVARRLQQELGFACPLQYLYKFKYQARYGTVGAEHEYCWVYFGRYSGPVDVNLSEIADWRHVGVVELEAELSEAPESFTPWFKMEWQHIRENFLDKMLDGVLVDG
jgi:isopentenyl-diphosphate delta-isomerase